MLAPISDGLKAPLHFCTEKALGRCLPMVPDDPSYLGNLCRRVDAFASVIFYSLLCLPSLPVWFIGDAVEWIFQGNKPFQDPVKTGTLSEPVHLNAETENVGASLSTYQYTSKPNFCENSDWGVFNKDHFAGKTAKDGLGQGVDILTKEGREQIIQAIKDCNGNSLRFSVEWAHVINANGDLDSVAMQEYIEAANDLQANGIESIITLHHFVNPIDKNGNSLFENTCNIDKFVKFAKLVYQSMPNHVTRYVTFNEPNVTGVQNYVLGMFPAKGKGNFWKHTQVVRNMLEAHRRVYDELHSLAGNNPISVGLTHQALRFIPSSRFNYLARVVSYIFTFIFHTSFMQWAVKNKNKMDFMGVQYYTTPLLGGMIPDSTCRKGEVMVEGMRFRFHPDGLLPILQEVGKKLKGVPLWVTEFGTAGPNNPEVADDMDTRRKNYMKGAFGAIAEAQKTVKIVGVLFWGIFHNFEWNFGYSEKHNFGNIAGKGLNGEYRRTNAINVIGQVYKNTLEFIQKSKDKVA